jgi:hypothetical protein
MFRISLLLVPLAATAIAFAACGGKDDDQPAGASTSASLSATAERSPSPSASASGSPDGTRTVVVTTPPPGVTRTPAPNQSPRPTPTQVPPATVYVQASPTAVAAGPYCNKLGPDTPPNSVIGTMTIKGSPVPAGKAVGLAFDGVPGPSQATRAAGGYRVDFSPGDAACANRDGASIAIIVDGVLYPTPLVVGAAAGQRFDLLIP